MGTAPSPVATARTARTGRRPDSPCRIRTAEGVDWREIAMGHGKTKQALEIMEIQREGKAGRLTLTATVIDEENAPVFASVRVWESVTSYNITRHQRHLSDENTLRKDLATELRRIDLPRLDRTGIEVIEVNSGPRGGLSRRFHLTFHTAKPSPLLTGQSMHRGEAIFVAVC